MNLYSPQQHYESLSPNNIMNLYPPQQHYESLSPQHYESLPPQQLAYNRSIHYSFTTQYAQCIAVTNLFLNSVQH